MNPPYKEIEESGTTRLASGLKKTEEIVDGFQNHYRERATCSDCCFVTAASIATAEPHLPSFAAKNALKRIGSDSVGVFPESEPSRK